jgi:hypothetical protein
MWHTSWKLLTCHFWETRIGPLRECHMSSSHWWELAEEVDDGRISPSFSVSAPPLSVLRRRCRRQRRPQPCLWEAELWALSSFFFVCGCWVHWGGGSAWRYPVFCVVSVDIVQEVWWYCFLVAQFLLRGTSGLYEVVSFCFHGVRLFTGFASLEDGCGCWRQERILPSLISRRELRLGLVRYVFWWHSSRTQRS